MTRVKCSSGCTPSRPSTRSAAGTPGGVHDAIELAEVPDGGLDRVLHVGFARHVGLDEAHRGRSEWTGACQLRGFGAPFLVVEVENDRARAGGHHHVHDGAAQS